MNILNDYKRNSACFGLCVAGFLCFSRVAAAEVTLVEKDGWNFSFDGRVNAFLSVGQGDDFPKPTPNPELPGATHTVMGQSKPIGVADAGWKSAVQADANNKYFAMRVRSGLVGNVIGFGLERKINDIVKIKGYVSIWSTVETLGRDKWYKVTAEAREAFFTADGPWGSATVGRTFGWFGRMSSEIDYLYGHGYGVGLPCTDEVGPACGHIGTGVAYPGYSAGFAYSSPSLGGLKFHAGLYDPIVFGDVWKRAPYLRPEGAISFETPLGPHGKLKFEAEGLYQPLARVVTDQTTMQSTDVNTSVWGGAGGARIELGPVRLGAAAFHGRGIGLGYALQNSSATLDSTTYELRTFTGFYGQAALLLGKFHIAAGGGAAAADQLASDRANSDLSVIRRQIGVSGAVYYHATDNVVFGLDYFRFMASWYGAPALDANMALTANVLPGERQNLNFVNAGVTYHW